MEIFFTILIMTLVVSLSGVVTRVMPFQIPLPLMQIAIGALLAWPTFGLHVEFDPAHAMRIVYSEHLKADCPATAQVQMAAEDSYDRLIFPSLEREMRNLLSDTASEAAIKVFGVNLRQLLMQSVCVYVVQLVSKIIEKRQCITSNPDQMSRFLDKMSSVQNERTVIVIDDINEFMDYFNSVSDLNAFVMKSIQRNIQIFALIRRPFSLASTLMDQFHRKLIFSAMLKFPYLLRDSCKPDHSKENILN